MRKILAILLLSLFTLSAEEQPTPSPTGENSPPVAQPNALLPTAAEPDQPATIEPPTPPAEPAPLPVSPEPVATAPAPAAAPAKTEPVIPLAAANADQLSTTKENIFEAVDILGDGILFSPTIWSDMLRLDESDRMVQEQIEEKKFANDPYFMRNIDREEFEEERILLLFEDRARLYEKYLAEMRAQLAADSAAAALVEQR